MIKVLHTADWHLGKRLELMERTDEQQHFLKWLLQTINAACIDVLVVAGDIFDSGSPSNTAQKQYYDFLLQVTKTCCKEVVIIGGNHDSVSLLEAPGGLLKHINVHVVGGVPADVTEQILPIRNSAGDIQLIVCAIPFLRDKDVRRSVAGESRTEMEARLKEGICAHYKMAAEQAAPYKAQNIPVLATGHLFAQGSAASGSEQDIHVGNLGQICGDQFPDVFDYIALGHIHRPQVVNGMQHIRYSGSPIPLSFSEADDCKLVLILSFDQGKLSALDELPVLPCRKLIRISGTIDKVKEALLASRPSLLSLPSWVEVAIHTPACIPNVEEELYQLIADKPFIEKLFIRQINLLTPKACATEQPAAETLFDLEPKTVFRRRCSRQFGDEDFTDLLQTFDTALELMQSAQTQ